MANVHGLALNNVTDIANMVKNTLLVTDRVETTLWVNGNPVVYKPGSTLANMRRLFKAMNPNNAAFDETRTSKVRHGKKSSWPVPKSKGNRF